MHVLYSLTIAFETALQEILNRIELSVRLSVCRVLLVDVNSHHDRFRQLHTSFFTIASTMVFKLSRAATFTLAIRLSSKTGDFTRSPSFIFLLTLVGLIVVLRRCYHSTSHLRNVGNVEASINEHESGAHSCCHNHPIY
jgi:hypothetical protein